MSKGIIYYIVVDGPSILITITFSYLKYKRKAKKYMNIFRKTLIIEGVDRKMARQLSSNIKILNLREIITLRESKYKKEIYLK